jgi:hypothetical protein
LNEWLGPFLDKNFAIENSVKFNTLKIGHIQTKTNNRDKALICGILNSHLKALAIPYNRKGSAIDIKVDKAMTLTYNFIHGSIK